MTLAEYVRREGHGSIKALAHRADVSEPTLRKCIRGEGIGQWQVAKRISEATGGEVTPVELVEPAEGAA